MVIHRLLR